MKKRELKKRKLFRPYLILYTKNKNCTIRVKKKKILQLLQLLQLI